MIQLQSGDGKNWTFLGVTSRVQRIRDLTGIDLGLNYESEGLQKFQRLIEDRPTALKVLLAAVEQQDDANRLSADEWDGLWPTDYMIKALFAIGKEAARFFTPLRSQAAISGLSRLEKEYLRVLAELAQTISTVDLQQTAAST